MPAVLLVDDDPDDGDLLRLAFRRHGADADLAITVDVDHALALLQQMGPGAGRPGPLPAVVLLDLKLGATGGLEVLGRIRRSPATTALPVVVMTSSVEPRDVEEAYAAGANGYVRKPDTFEELVTAVGAILQFWVYRNEMPGRRAQGACR
ncbi:MAG: response regulator [Vicinamibacterales bacterium]